MISSATAKTILLRHLLAETKDMVDRIDPNRILDGWPEDDNRDTTQPVWSIMVPTDQSRVGSCRWVVISKLTGDVLADRQFGE